MSESNATAENTRETPKSLLALESIPQPLRRVLHEAIHENASDVHFDPVGDSKAIRYRVDGVLHEKELVGYPERAKLVNLVKVNSGMSPDRTITPMEGLMLLSHDDTAYDVRVTIMPVLDREAVHLRFVASKHGLLGIDDIGLCEHHRDRLRSLLGDHSSGLVLIAGPTGSGKTTTMYALVSSMALHSQVIASIEDPVEFRIPYLRQIQVDERHGLSMQEGLRALLRMDPDVLAVGEIRDQVSAMIASRASMTGRLVLATIHAPTAPVAITALQNLSVSRHVLGNALRMVITQDLLPRLCTKCRRSVAITDEQKALFETHGLEAPESLHVANGCEACHGYGHAGRIGVFEVLEIDTDMGYALGSGMSQRDLTQMFRDKAGHSLLADALTKAAAGTVSFEAVRRVAGGAA